MSGRRYRWSTAQVLAWAVLVAAALWILAPVPSSLSKDLELTGTIDCGVGSGKPCDVGDTVFIWTDDVDGTRRLVAVDVSWIRSQVSGVDQDDLISFEVRDLGDGHFQALAIHDQHGQDGTHVQGASTGSHQASQNGNRCGATCDGDDTLNSSGGADATATATLAPTSTTTITPSPTLTATATFTSTAVPTATGTATATQTATATATSTLTATPTSTATATATSTATSTATATPTFTPTVTPTPLPGVSISDATLDPPTESIATFTITLNTASLLPVSVLFMTHDGTGPAGYHAPADYTAVTTTVVFPPGSTSQTVNVHLVNTNCGFPFVTHNLSAVISVPVNAVIIDDTGIALIPPASAC
jgi:hypothetical protein